jgi:plasmid segregation protein ParM
MEVVYMFGKKDINEVIEPRKVVIVVDPGKFMTKSIMEGGKKFSFRTKFTKVDSFEDMIKQGNSYMVDFDKKKFIIGDQGIKSSYDVTKTNILHKIAVYTSIIGLFKDDINNIIVRLVISCPASIWRDTNQRKDYKNFILNENKDIKINIDNKDYNINIENVLVVPEGMGVVAKYPKHFENKRTAVGDYGGLNYNRTTYDDMRFDLDEKSSFTRNLGNNRLETKLINELNSKLALNINKEDAVYILQDGGMRYQGEITNDSAKIVEQVKKEFVEEIDIENKKNDFDLQMMNYICVGGLTQLIEKELQEKYPHAIILDNAQWVHVEGALDIGINKYNKK